MFCSRAEHLALQKIRHSNDTTDLERPVIPSNPTVVGTRWWTQAEIVTNTLEKISDSQLQAAEVPSSTGQEAKRYQGLIVRDLRVWAGGELKILLILSFIKN